MYVIYLFWGDIVRLADFKAKIKKIEIVNKSGNEKPFIRLILDDIDLTPENLLEILQFKPSEIVYVEIKPVQLSMFDINVQAVAPEQSIPEQSPPKLKVIKTKNVSTEELTGRDDDFITVIDEGPGGDPNEDADIITEWKFDK